MNYLNEIKLQKSFGICIVKNCDIICPQCNKFEAGQAVRLPCLHYTCLNCGHNINKNNYECIQCMSSSQPKVYLKCKSYPTEKVKGSFNHQRSHSVCEEVSYQEP